VFRPAVLVFVMVAALAGSAHATPSDRIRPLDPLARHLLDVGRNGSPTFARLFEAVERSGLYVYVDVRSDLTVPQSGRLQFSGAHEGRRFLRVRIDTGTTCRALQLSRQYELAAIIGHELQHALEVADELDVDSAESFEAFYHAIGLELRPHAFDTRAAQHAGQQVLRELRGGSPAR
jgi:hypothetical protein